MMSGGPIAKFTEHWAVKLFTWGRAHYFVREQAGRARALCGAQDSIVGQLREAGDWTRCGRCSAMLKRKQAA